MTGKRPLDPARIAAAASIIDPVFRNSPAVAQPALDEALGAAVLCKIETLNPIRSFKGRGTDNFVAALDAGKGGTLVCASAGNFGQGLAYAAARRAFKCVVYHAAGANPVKVAAMRRFGATCVSAGADFDAAKDAAREFARRDGHVFVEDGDAPEIAEGAGTLARELTEAGHRFDDFVIPLGNGALATGCGAWHKHRAPSTRVVAVVAAGAPCMKLSWEAGRVVETKTADTIADGVATRVPVPYALETMRGTIDEVLAVGEEAIVSAMRLAHETLGLVVEPAGAVGLAALIEHKARFRGRRIATALCGANVAREQARRWLFG
jgi:threonine dehydratase